MKKILSFILICTIIILGLYLSAHTNEWVNKTTYSKIAPPKTSSINMNTCQTSNIRASLFTRTLNIPFYLEYKTVSKNINIINSNESNKHIIMTSRPFRSGVTYPIIQVGSTIYTCRKLMDENFSRKKSILYTLLAIIFLIIFIIVVLVIPSVRKK